MGNAIVRKRVPFHHYHDGLMRIKSLIIRVDTMHRPWLAVKMAVVFHYICFCEPVAQYENKVLVVTWIFLEENPVLLVRCCLPFTQKLQCYVVQ